MRRLFIICLLALFSAALVGFVPAASAATTSAGAAAPAITRVTPMRLSVGERLTIRGRHFKARRLRNTVIFRAPNGRTAFAKPRRATVTKLVVVVPDSVARLLTVSGGEPKPTRLRLRVLAGKFSKFTPRRLSPVVTGFGGGAGGGGGGSATDACNTTADHDGDLLSNSYELQIGTNPCVRDSDLDGVDDGFEEQSAIDINGNPRTPPLPYPGKRPYPNALDPTDGATDYDQDGLRLRDEYMLWTRYSADGVRRQGAPTSLSGLLYSDGLQKSADPAPAPPGDLLAAYALEIRVDGQLWDDERDADGDGLSNWDETGGRMTEGWWPAEHDGKIEPSESKYPDLDYLDNEDTAPAFDAAADPDLDGDGVPDGADDTDHDGLSNQFEVSRPVDWDAVAFVDSANGNLSPGPNPWAYTNPFNPCKPFKSERCHAHPPFGYYDSDERPPVGPLAPAGFPDVHPTTPAG
jgi:hypothetical protein